MNWRVLVWSLLPAEDTVGLEQKGVCINDLGSTEELVLYHRPLAACWRLEVPEDLTHLA